MAETKKDFLADLGFETDRDKVQQSMIVPAGEFYKLTQQQEEPDVSGGFIAGAGLAYEEEWISSLATRNFDRLTTSGTAPVTEFTPEIVDFLTKDLEDPRAYTEVLEEANRHGMERATMMRDSYLQTQSNIKEVGNLGFSGTTGYVLGSMFDVGELAAIGGTVAAVSAVSAPIAPITGTATAVVGAAKQARKGYNISKAFWRGAGLTAAETAAFEQYRNYVKYDVEANDVWIAMGAGAVLGGTLTAGATALSKRARLAKITKKKINGEELTPEEIAFDNAFSEQSVIEKHVDDFIKNAEAENEAQVPLAKAGEAPIPELPKMSGANILGLRNIMFAGVRTGNSDVEQIRRGSRALAMNSTGYKPRADGSRVTNTESASEVQERMSQVADGEYVTAYDKAETAWVKRTGGTRSDFNVLISRRARNIITDADPEVESVVDVVRRQEDELFTEAVNRNAAGFTEEARIKDGSYLPRIFNEEKIRVLRQRLGKDAEVHIAALIERAMYDAQPNLLENVKASLFKDKTITDAEAEAYVTKIARGYTKGISQPRIGSRVDNSEFTLEDLRDIIKENVDDLSNVSDIDLDNIISVIAGNSKVKGHKRTRPRLQLNEAASVRVANATGEIEEIHFHELLEEDIEVLHKSYIFQTTGAIGLARNGINTNDLGSTFEAYKKSVLDEIRDKNLDPKKHEAEINSLEFMYDHITGRLAQREGVSTNQREFAITARAASFMASMGMAGFSAAMELSNVIFSTSIPVLLKSMPAYKNLLTKASTTQMPENVLQEFMDAFGWGSEVATGAFKNNTRFQDINSLQEITGSTTTSQRLAQKGQAFVAKWSGLQGVTQTLRRMNMINFSNAWARSVRTGKMPYHASHMEQLGIDNDMAVSILRNMKKHSTIKSDRITKLNISEWDADARDAFKAAGSKETRQNVQEMNIGSTNSFIRGEWNKLWFQFLSFPTSALEQQFNRLYTRGIRGDVGVAKIMLASVMQGTLMYTTRVHLNSLGRDDPEKYIKENMQYDKLIAGALSQIGALSFFGLVYDNTVGSRTGNVTMISPPILSIINSLKEAGEFALTGEASEAEIRKALRALPLQSLWVVNQALNGMAAQIAKQVD